MRLYHVAADARFDLSQQRNLQTWFDRVRSQPGFVAGRMPQR